MDRVVNGQYAVWPRSLATGMVRRKSSKAAERDVAVERAIEALSRREFSNVNQVAKHFNVHYTTLQRRYNGGKSIAESREPQQLYTIAEEHAIIQWITRLTSSGYPVTHSLIEEIAEEVRKRRVIGINEPSIQYVTYEPLGGDWTLRFLKRHPQLQTAMTRSIELACITEARLVVVWWVVLSFCKSLGQDRQKFFPPSVIDDD